MDFFIDPIVWRQGLAVSSPPPKVRLHKTLVWVLLVDPPLPLSTAPHSHGRHFAAPAPCARGGARHGQQYAPATHAQQSQVLKLKTIMRINVGRTFNDVRPAGGSRANAHVEAWERQYAPVCASPRLVWARNRARDKGDTARLGFQQRLTRPLHPRAPAPCCARPRSPKPNAAAPM